jgi:orotidine-5'-phosphate decarboxylase
VEGILHYALCLVDFAEEMAIPFVKPQAAFFECFGPDGLAAYAQVLSYARALGRLTIADVKRGDIGSTSAAYARAFLGEDAPFRADAMTLSPYLGDDGLAPFVEAATAASAGLFVLVRTSNPGARLLQEVNDEAGQPLYARVAAYLTEHGRELVDVGCGYSPLGAVIGATAPQVAVKLRAKLPHALILAPGVGAQGARPEDLTAFHDQRGEGVIVPVSRGISTAWQASDLPWRAATRAAIEALRERV